MWLWETMILSIACSTILVGIGSKFELILSWLWVRTTLLSLMSSHCLDRTEQFTEQHDRKCHHAEQMVVIYSFNNDLFVLQIKELTGNIKSQFPSSSSLSSIPTSSDSDTSHSSTPSDERKPTIGQRGHGKAIKTLLQWVQRRTRK